MNKAHWSDWQRFPDPTECGILCAPFGCGVYELRNSDTDELILFGKSKNVANRMTSLLRPPHGTGTRNNKSKQEYVSKYLAIIEYRTIATVSEEHARRIENKLKENKTNYVFDT